ncbi:MAG: 4-hydroxy-tetrahydrodipicolinate synthase [Salana multivorans]|uniref:4-hydroxy-tetrahydrodipicolinate synthase n=1 Tax=Salana multivorans TaxID=120377 RepID=UPI00096576D0|nr:4-hydroxy-tetrahydrodipicolinate synthase [Salana multivorans]MBN8882275.1 4-hydroxy-tetrahydrodipicolinate synthase [Salana multivorans]OJX95640.1 MAG: 4-hydroxy-tetrahydrodipicolinate synthase [Micrococcales bacterium 73-15]
MTRNAAALESFGSVLVAMVTPMDADGDLDIDAAVVLAEKLVADGVSGIVLNGTTGESPTTHQPEKDALVRAVVDAVGDRVRIVAGAGSNDTKHAVRIAASAERTGAHGLLINAPYYNRPSQEGVYRHIRAVADAADLPVMLYDIPGRTGVAIGDEALDRLAEHPRVLAVKDATGDVPAGFARMRRTGLAFYSGDDALNLAWLTHGAVGVVSVIGHVVAGPIAEMVGCISRGDLRRAQDLAVELVGVCDAIMGAGQGAVYAKAALDLLGVIPSRAVRSPLVAATEDELADLAERLRVAGLFPAP